MKVIYLEVSSFDKGLVQETSPAKGSKVEEGDTIDLRVSIRSKRRHRQVRTAASAGRGKSPYLRGFRSAESPFCHLAC